MKIGIPSSYFGEGLDEEVRAAILKAADILKEKGAIVETFDLDLVDYCYSCLLRSLLLQKQAPTFHVLTA